ncbi:MAG: PAS domain-containing sensor histidine kinase [Desulfamplus sp.]|nr:PAS domain-containing sensor histidine kinase [Desulfamplus sp.]
MILPYFPILAVDILGSLGMILFAMLALNNAIKLKKRDTDNVMYLYLLWICWGFTIFAISRALGHIVRQLMVIYGHSDWWASISPYSGTINTVSFMLMGILTLFFNQNWKINMKILESRRALEETHKTLEDTHAQLVRLNQTLEQKVAERTDIIMKNINEKKEMEQQIAQADKLAALGELAAGVAHEINNPLGIILGYTQLMLKDKSIENSDFYEDLKVIEKHVKNCKSVVSDMLTFSRKGSVKQGVVNLNHVVNDVVKFLHNHSDFKNIEMTLELYSQDVCSIGACCNVLGNEQELRQVVVNLLINACHAVDKKGKINIKTRLDNHKIGAESDGVGLNLEMLDTNIKINGENAEIWVQDNGKGITPENLSRIFDPFFTTKPVGQGTGLGLSVSYGIVKKHGGRIEVNSVENEGALFKVILPCASSSLKLVEEKK